LRFNEWTQAITVEHDKVKKFAVVTPTESITVEGVTITVTLGKEMIVHLNKTEALLRDLRDYYTANKESFAGLLESLRAQAESIASITNDIVTALVAPEVPKAVLRRISGEDDETTLVGTMVERKLKELAKEARKFSLPAKGTEFNLVPVATRSLSFGIDSSGDTQIEWGSVGINGDSVSLGEPEDQVFFLANFGIIKNRLAAFWQDFTVLAGKHLA
jgi:hypothetical protein